MRQSLVETFIHGPMKQLYNSTLRPHLPSKISVHNGIPVRGVVRLFDFNDEFPDYEGPLLEAIRNRVSPGDDVVIVGGGYGVTTAAAAKRTGRDGTVITYEGSDKRAQLVRQTVILNKVNDISEILHAVVGDAVKISGEKGAAALVHPAELPKCDVLELDCEGSELDILRELEIEPEVIIVETHDYLGSSEDDVRSELNHLSYKVTDRTVEDEERGIVILTAKRL